ncbi:MAG: hypothetical protein AAFY26_27390, partial [Cyanobacteria bacterium J06638_22]
IVDCLYDIGSARLIHQKVEPQILQDVTKPIARLSKPAARAFALRWVKKNCPVLLTNWLYSKVKFDKPKSKPKSQANPAPQPTILEEAAKQALAENTTAIANHPTQRQATSPLSQTPYPPDAAPPVEAALPDSFNTQANLDTPDTAIAPTPQASTLPDAAIAARPEATAAVAADEGNTARDRTDTGIVPLSEYNRAIAQIKYRDNELRRLRAQVRIFMALVLGSAIAMGGLLLSFAPTTELSQPTVTGQSQVEE